ncbi:hypothetical protein [Brachybacterium sp. UMB0905]|uniref:hypothetical protein n=1 Tax=Brachybacterium sp. UMB0905 TaxID=2069310 RepID=UPI000C7FEB78|nr:hypothetical protein [Brachybacterium sp. UMB0905]PMC74499.1 hypothetical protein CJ197_12915 [Brachybacterium sp. UMB0905]
MTFVAEVVEELLHCGPPCCGAERRGALTRTLLRAADAPGGVRESVLVLDEATSHQDALTQERIIDGLREVGATIVMIARRPVALRDADQVLRLEDGRVVG